MITLKSTNKYPKLMIAEDGDVFLFFKPRNGVLIQAGTCYLHVGFTYSKLDMSLFKPYTETLELKL